MLELRMKPEFRKEMKEKFEKPKLEKIDLLQETAKGNCYDWQEPEPPPPEGGGGGGGPL